MTTARASGPIGQLEALLEHHLLKLVNASSKPAACFSDEVCVDSVGSNAP
jgi:hypothetical protein